MRRREFTGSEEEQIVEQIRNDQFRLQQEDINGSEFKQSRALLNDSLRLSLQNALDSTNEIVREEANRLVDRLGGVGDWNTITSNPQLVNELQGMLGRATELDESLASDFDLITSITSEQGMTDSDRAYAAQQARSSSRPEEEYVRRVSPVNGETYVVSASNPEEYYSESEWEANNENLAPNALGWELDGGGEYADLTVK